MSVAGSSCGAGVGDVPSAFAGRALIPLLTPLPRPPIAAAAPVPRPVVAAPIVGAQRVAGAAVPGLVATAVIAAAHVASATLTPLLCRHRLVGGGHPGVGVAVPYGGLISRGGPRGYCTKHMRLRLLLRLLLRVGASRISVCASSRVSASLDGLRLNSGGYSQLRAQRRLCGHILTLCCSGLRLAIRRSGGRSSSSHSCGARGRGGSSVRLWCSSAVIHSARGSSSCSVAPARLWLVAMVPLAATHRAGLASSMERREGGKAGGRGPSSP